MRVFVSWMKDVKNYFFLCNIYLYTRITAPTTITNTIMYGANDRSLDVPATFTADQVKPLELVEEIITPIKAKNMTHASKTSNSLFVNPSMISPSVFFTDNITYKYSKIYDAISILYDKYLNVSLI